MGAPRQPTNLDLERTFNRRLDDMQAILTNQGKILEEHDRDIRSVVRWQEIETASRKAARAAVDEYKAENKSSGPLSSELVKALLKALGIIVAILGLLSTGVIK